MDAGNAVTPLCFPNFQNEVLALADASAVNSSAVPTLLRFRFAGTEAPGVSALASASGGKDCFLSLLPI